MCEGAVPAGGDNKEYQRLNMAREEVEVKGWVNHRTLTSETMILITYAANSQPIFFFLMNNM